MLPWISADALLARLGDPDMRIVDVRAVLGRPDDGRAAYAAGHLPGATHLDLEDDLSGPLGRHGGRHPLPAVDVLAATFGAVGIGPEHHVVAYDAGDAMVAGRLWWLLRWLGHDAVQVLDGGFEAWLAAGGPVTTAVVPPAPATFVPRPRADMLIDRGALLAALGDPGRVIVDARASERYRGEIEPLDPRAGHVPGAVNYPYTDNLEGGVFRDPEALRARFAPLASAREVVVYCGSGVSAAHDLMALEAAGIRGAKLYAGSWSDWVSHDDAPVAVGTEP